MTMTFIASVLFVATSCVTSNKLENIFNDEYVVTKVDGLIESNDVSSIITNTITKQYVEGLGITGGGGDVASVNGQTGTVVITAFDVGAWSTDWMPTAADVGAVAVQANGGVAIGAGTTASGYFSHAEGANTIASGDFSHAEGTGTTASGYFSHAEGISANANDDYSFAWNGDLSITYNSHGRGTFNLNPLGGLSGLWIGESSLATILGEYAKKSGETNTVDFSSAQHVYVPTQTAVSGKDAVNVDMMASLVGSRGVTNITDGVTSGTYNEETRTANIRPLLGYTNYALSGTNQTLALDRSVQYVSISGTNALKVLAPTRVYDKARDFLVYVNTAGTNALDLTELTGIYSTDASATNAVTKGMTMLMFTELTTNTWVIGRQTLNALK